MTRNRRNRWVGAAVVTAALFLGTTAAWAHHEIAGKFDLSKTVNLTGIVTYVDWRNPHAHVFVNVKTGKALLNWAIELESPTILERDGWNSNTLRPGDAIAVKGPQARDGSRQVWGGDQVRFTETGLPVFPAKLRPSRAAEASRAAPRWPDGHPALGGLSPGDEGYWIDPSKTALVEDGVDVKTDEWGLLANPTDASKVAPMQPWALGVFRHRQERLLRDDPMYLSCKPPGGPRQFQSRLGVEFVEDRAHERIFVLMGSGNHNYRIIYMDQKRTVGLVTGDDDNPLYFGRSSGKWEGDTLVVDTIGFNEDFWFTNGGLPHTSQLHLVERFTRSDFDTLRYQVQVDDPGAYTRNWSAGWTMKWRGGSVPFYFCQNNRP
jgi:Family of unknown function (DUF6152)